MTDSHDTYSLPTSSRVTKLAKIFIMKARSSLDKPGKTVVIMSDARMPLVPGFNNKYSYIVRFKGVGSKAGNHYHRRKDELYSAIQGEFTILIENIQTKEREELSLKAGDNMLLYVQAPYAHAVISKTTEAVLLVMATNPDVEDDVFAYPIA